MYPVSARFLRAIRSGGVADIYCTAWQGTTFLQAIPVIGGKVTVDGSKVSVRRTLDLTTTADMWSVLNDYAIELRVYRGVVYSDGTSERVPLGVFGVDTRKLAYGPSGSLSLTCADRFATVQRAQFETPETTSGSAVSEISRLALGAFSSPPSSTVDATSVVDCTDSLFDRDRAKAISDLCKTAACEAYFDVDGDLVVRDLPSLTSSTVWTVNVGEGGVLVAASKERSRLKAYSVIIVTAADVDGFPPFDPVVVEDTDPLSPTYVGGNFGRVPYFYSAPEIADEDQAQSAGEGFLEAQRGRGATLSLEAVVNPALEAGDSIAVTFSDGTAETHLVDGFTVPLDVNGTQSITTRSTEPE